MHICPDEILAIMMAMPFIGGFFHWLRHKLRRSKCHQNDTCIPKCDHPTEEAVYDPLDP